LLGLLLLAALATIGLPARSAAAAPNSSAAPMAYMEATHASYLDLAGNIADLRNRVTQWQAGDESSLGIAGEKLDRIQVILASVSWPAALIPAIDKARSAVEPMAMALKAKDRMMADQAAKAFGDASHDVTHAFYGNWLLSLQGSRFTDMAPHASYLDLSANIADLRSRVAQWQGGDESSLAVAKEKVDRINVLVQHMSTFGVLANPLQGVGAALPAISAALDKKDPAAAQTALKPIADASHDLTHGFYTWLGVTAGPHDPDCIQAAYLDLSLNVTDLRTRIGDWQKGDENGLTIGQEKLDRAQAILGHVNWPAPLSAAIEATRMAIQPLGQAFKDKNVAVTQAALKPIGDASHDLTHAYYGNWLATAHSGEHMQGMGGSTGNNANGMGNTGMPAGQNSAPAMSSSVQDESKPHGHGTEVPVTTTSRSSKNLVLAGFGGVNAMVVALAAVLKQRAVRQAKAKAATRVQTALGGASE
jgi:hypothetical protein